ncbi:MAG: hypothetical protein ACR2GO_02345 [Candidatus Limnocylindria bacterium]
MGIHGSVAGRSHRVAIDASVRVRHQLLRRPWRARGASVGVESSLHVISRGDLTIFVERWVSAVLLALAALALALAVLPAIRRKREVVFADEED